MGNRSRVTLGSGNVFADLGIPNAEDRHARTVALARLYGRIQRLQWPTLFAASRLGLKEEELNDLLRGRFERFTAQDIESMAKDLDLALKVGRYFAGTAVPIIRLRHLPFGTKKRGLVANGTSKKRRHTK